jgi:two-component system phosphate regulon response regulator PhoB
LARVLLVDSSSDDRSSISRQLRDAGHDAVCAADAAEALRLLEHSPFDAVITEWLLTDATALDLADSLRRNPRTAGARVLIASRRGEPHDIARAFDHGIDEYLIKPAEAEELVARVNAALRRPVAVSRQDALQVGPVSLNRVAHRVTIHGTEIDLAPAEFRLLAFLMENQGRVVGRKQLLAQVWNRRKGIGERTVDVHVRRLRAAFAPHGCEDLLHTVRGFGYRLG